MTACTRRYPVKHARRASVALTLVGLLVALYLTAVDLLRGEVPLVCVETGIVNCDVVTTSPQSHVGPVPVALLGVVWFLGMLLLLRSEGDDGLLGEPVLQLAWTGAGAIMVAFLVYAELAIIGAICLWCTVIHAVVVALFAIAVARYARGLSMARSA